MSEYALICLYKQDSEYVSYNTYLEVTLQVSGEYLLNPVKDWVYSEPGKWSEMERFANIIIVFNSLCKKNSVLNLWEGSEYVLGFAYIRVLNIIQFSFISLGSEYASGYNYGRVPEYFRIPSMPVFCVCKCCTKF